MNKKNKASKGKEIKFIDHKKFNLILNLIPICTVDVLFFNPDKTKVLLFKRNNAPLKSAYFSIGGRLLKNETIEECAVRQALVESGLALKKKDLVLCGVQDEIHTTSIFENTSYHAVNIFYAIILADEKSILLDKQHSSCNWFDVNDASMHKYMKSKVALSLEKIKHYKDR